MPRSEQLSRREMIRKSLRLTGGLLSIGSGLEGLYKLANSISFEAQGWSYLSVGNSIENSVNPYDPSPETFIKLDQAGEDISQAERLFSESSSSFTESMIAFAGSVVSVVGTTVANRILRR